MSRFFRVLGRVLSWLLRSRALRPVLGLLVFAWLLDGAVTVATDAAWFSSVGLEALWRHQWAWRAGVSGVFVGFCLALSVPLLRAVARPVAPETQEPPLPRALVRFEPLRARATRLGWLLILLVALGIGRDLGAHWSEFALAFTRESGNAATNWMMRAPAFASVLGASWCFVLVAGAVVLGAGVLRALPFLAARPGVNPVRWLRALRGVGASLCVLRALGYVFEAVRHAQIADEAAFARVLFVLLNILGAIGCGVLLFSLKRPRWKLAFGVAATLMLPSIGSDLVSPFAHQNQNAPQLLPSFHVSNGAPQSPPAWDEVTMLRAARLQVARDPDNRIIEWKSAGINPARKGRGLRADLVGAPVVSDAWVGHDVTGNTGDLNWNSLDLPGQTPSRDGQPIGPLFFGLNARPLIGNEAGVPFEGIWKVAWAWRLRDPLLLFDGARSKRLLVWRGAQEAGQKIAPFFSWGEAVPRRDARTGSAYFECVAYSSSANFPRRAPFEAGEFAGQNAVFPVAVLRLDARTGALHIAPFAGLNPFVARWKVALPSLFGSNAPQNAPTPALETALSAGAPLVWTRDGNNWGRRALPLSLRAPVEKKLSEFAGVARSKAKIALEGTSPVLWREGEKLFLAQSFFDLTPSATPQIATPNHVLPQPAGVAIGPLERELTQWNSTFDQARTMPSSPQVRPTPPTSPENVPSSHQLTLETSQALTAANVALQAGRYAEWHRQNARANSLIEELERRTRLK